MNFIIFIIFSTCFVSHIHGYNYDAGNTGHNPYMDDKTRSSFKRRNILGQNLDKNGKTKHIPLYSRYNNNKRYDKLDYKTHFIEPTNDPIVNEYILNKKLISKPRKINLDDDIIVRDLYYYDKFSFKDNWAKSWKDSDVW
jgi:hypothetical protein